MNGNVTIRPFVDTDIPQIALIGEECFSQPWSENALKEFSESAFSHIITAFFDGVVAGYITYSQIFEEIQIANVAVKKDFRRMGLGNALIHHLISSGNNDGCEVITLEVRASNVAAIALYENNGFERVGVRKNFYSNPKEDAILMNYSYPSRKE